MKAVVDTIVPKIASEPTGDWPSCAVVCARRIYEFVQGRDEIRRMYERKFGGHRAKGRPR